MMPRLAIVVWLMLLGGTAHAQLPVWQYLDPTAPEAAVWVHWKGPAAIVSSPNADLTTLTHLAEDVHAARFRVRTGDTVQWSIAVAGAPPILGQARLSSPRPWSMVVLGDTQRSSPTHEGVVLRHAAEATPDMVVVVGDWAMSMSSTETYGVRIMRLFTMAPDLWRNAVVFPVAGNHDRGAVPTYWFDRLVFPFADVDRNGSVFPSLSQSLAENQHYLYGGVRLVVANAGNSPAWKRWWAAQWATMGPEPILAFRHHLWAWYAYYPGWWAQPVIAWHGGHTHMEFTRGTWIIRDPTTGAELGTSPTWRLGATRESTLAPPEPGVFYMLIRYDPKSRTLTRLARIVTTSNPPITMKLWQFTVTVP